MKTTKNYSILLVLFLISSVVNAQEIEEERAEAKERINDKFPSTRAFDFQMHQYTPADFDSELYDKDYQNGKMANYTKLRFAANLPIIKKPKWALTGSLLYNYSSLKFEDVENKMNPSLPMFDYKEDFHYFSGTLNSTYFTKLFNKPFIINGSVTLDASDKDFGRIKGNVMGTFILKKTDRTRISLGAMVFIDPTAPIPAAPIFAVEHKFKNNNWTMDFILPQRLLFKRGLLENGRISIGSEVDGDSFYVSTDQFGANNMYDFRQLELKTGITYEYAVGDVIFTVKGGMANFFQNQLIEKGKLAKDYVFDLNRKGSGYFTLGVSYNPF